MLGLKVRKENAEKVKRYLTKHKLMAINYRVISTEEFIYFPITDSDAIKGGFAREMGAEVGEFGFKEGEAKYSYRDMLKEKLGKDYEQASRGYDVLGDVAVIDTVENKKAAKRTAQVIMALNKNIKTVLAKGGPVSGRFRTRKYEYIAGDKRYDVFYRENGATFHFDLRKTFFSSRLAFERSRITGLSKDGENVIVMFAGVGPFAIEIARANKNSRVVAMELNEDAVEYLRENIQINGTDNVVAEQGDVRDLSRKYPRFADRIIMPHPTDSFSYLDSVLKVARDGCIVHYYVFGKRGESFQHHVRKLRSFFAWHKKKFRVLFERTAREYSKDEVETVIDFELS